MSAISIEPGNEPDIESGGGLPLLAGERWLAAASSRDRRFVIALGATALLHAVFVIGIARSVPRYIGDPSGADNAISIAIVTEADLKSLSMVPETGDRPPGAPASAPPAPAPQPQSEPQPKSDQPETLRQSITEDTPEPKSEPKPELKPDPTLDSIPEPDRAPKKPVVKTQPPSPPKPKQSAKLDLTPPAPLFNAPIGGGGSAGFERPPGISRSGANDAFGYEVIKALKKTMPPHSGRFGRVTVRIILDLNGNVTDVQVVKSSKFAQIDQEVVFAARQTTYPFPPPNSIPIDRIFQVTYIYN